MPHPDVILLTSDSQSYLLSVDLSPKSGHFNDLLVVPMRKRATQMIIVDDETRSDGKLHAIMVGDLGGEETCMQILCVGQLQGPTFGKRFND